MTEKFTKQETFDVVCKGLAAQNWQQSVNRSGTCVYRSPKGLKCAAGHCIPDEEYKKDMEGHGAEYLTEFGSMPEFRRHDNDFLLRLQKLHDNDDYAYNMKFAFQEEAAEQGLEWKYD